MNIITHNKINQLLCGKPLAIKEDFSSVELIITKNMQVDETGLIHGGFIFGLADYSAMIAVNHPNVVLGSAEVKFLKPVKVNDKIIAEAKIISREGKKQNVSVTVYRKHEKVFEGLFICFVLDKHVLA
jgi:uncharacterized protein (TIGR00369 family)